MSRREIQVMTYNDWEELSNDVKHQKRMNYIMANKRMAAYYKRQRLMGYILAVIGLIAVAVGCANEWGLLNTLGVFVLSIGVYCLFTKRMIYIDRYYFECQDRLRNII